MRRATVLPVLFALASCAGASPPAQEAEPPILGIEEASGVTRVGDRLYIVGDHEPGTFYSMPLVRPQDGSIALRPEQLSRHLLAAGQYGIDLEAIDILADGRIVVLCERLSGLLDSEGLVAVYGNDLGEFGGRGFEGLAVRDLPGGASRVAVLWEGGYPEPGQLPPSVRDYVCQIAASPVVVLHDLPAGASGLAVHARDALRQIELDVPLPDGDEPFAQRFRTPDLVWHRLDPADEDSWGLIVLLSSGWGLPPLPDSADECPKRAADGEPLRWCYKWLQRFTLDGLPYGEPFDLDGVIPDALGDANWEGMGWYESGESLIFVYDELLAERAVDPQRALVVPLPDGW